MGNARATSHAEMASEGIANSSSSITHSRASRAQESGSCGGVANTFAVESETQVKINMPSSNASSILCVRSFIPVKNKNNTNPNKTHPPSDSSSDISYLTHPG